MRFEAFAKQRAMLVSPAWLTMYTRLILAEFDRDGVFIVLMKTRSNNYKELL